MRHLHVPVIGRVDHQRIRAIGIDGIEDPPDLGIDERVAPEVLRPPDVERPAVPGQSIARPDPDVLGLVSQRVVHVGRNRNS